MSESLDQLRKVVHELRARCPWDRKQTHKTLVPYLVEECFEATEAIESKQLDQLKEELGDLLLQVFLHAEIASEKKRFNLDGVAKSITEKLIRRHPHVYGSVRYKNAKTHLKTWNQLKEKEKSREFLLDGIPLSMPALQVAQKYGERASTVRFDWKDPSQVIEKLEEEIAELKQAVARNRKKEMELELGDVFFTLANLARHLDLDAEGCLRAACRKFEQRFQKLEKIIQKQGKGLRDCEMPELEAAWEKAKQ